MRYIFAVLAGIFCIVANARVWTPDSLRGYERTTVMLPEGRVCTIVRHIKGVKSGRAVLYVHGYNDYFFQKEEGNVFADSLYNFYAVDLHGYGRSIQKGETPYQATDVRQYYPDLDSALAIVRENKNTDIALMGHSTGGLITACYMNTSPRRNVKALILNSPFLDWNMSWFMRSVAVPVVSAVGYLFPKLSISQGDDTIYGQSLLKGYHGRWNYNVEWKTLHPRKVTAGWIHFVQSAQHQLKTHPYKIDVPILLIHSARSFTGKEWSDEATRADAVLNVEDIREQGMRLGRNVTELPVDGALHDVFLSAPRVVDYVNRKMFRWLQDSM